MRLLEEGHSHVTGDKIMWGSMRGVAEADAKDRIWIPVGLIGDVLKQF